MSTYFVAEWLSFNRDEVKASLEEQYAEVREMLEANALTRGDAADLIASALYEKFCAENTKVSPEDAMVAFSDDRVQTVIDHYYTKEFRYEH